MYVKSELLILSTNQDMGQSIQKHSKLKNQKYLQKNNKMVDINRVGVSNVIKFDLRYDPKRMCY